VSKNVLMVETAQCLAIPVVLMVASASAPINALVPTVLVDPNAWTRLALSFAKTEECALCHQIHANAERDFTGGDATGRFVIDSSPSCGQEERLTRELSPSNMKQSAVTGGIAKRIGKNSKPSTKQLKEGSLFVMTKITGPKLIIPSTKMNSKSE